MKTSHVRIWFDTNAGIDEDTYSLNCQGTLRDLTAHRIELREGMNLTLYMEDEDVDGRAALLLVDAVVERRETWGLIARVDPETWRRETIDGS
jgi:hypothetical protein